MDVNPKKAHNLRPLPVPALPLPLPVPNFVSPAYIKQYSDNRTGARAGARAQAGMGRRRGLTNNLGKKGDFRL